MGTIIILFLIGATPFLLLCLLAYFLINVGKTKRIRKQQEESDVMAQRIGHYTAKEMCNTNESEKEEIIRQDGKLYSEWYFDREDKQCMEWLTEKEE